MIFILIPEKVVTKELKRLAAKMEKGNMKYVGIFQSVANCENHLLEGTRQIG